MAITQDNLDNLNDTTAVMVTKKAVGQLIYNIQQADNALTETITNDIIGTSNDQITDSTNTATYNFSLNGIKNYIDNLTGDRFGDTAGNGIYITSVKQQNGSITATTASAIITYTDDNKNSKFPTSNSAITAAINTLNINTITANNGKYIKSIGQSAGKVIATTANFNPYLVTENELSTTTPTQSFKVNIGGSTGSTAVSLIHATTETYGVVRISNSINSDSETDVATSKAIKKVYNLANNMSIFNKILNKNNWQQRQDFYYNKERSYFGPVDDSYCFDLTTDSNEFIVPTNSITSIEDVTNDFNDTGYRLVKKENSNGQTTFNSNYTYYKKENNAFVQLTIEEGQGYPDGIDVYIKTQDYSEDVNNIYYVNWTLFSKNDFSYENNTNYMNTTNSNILNTKPASDFLTDSAWYLNIDNSGANKFYSDNDVLIISPLQDSDWTIWRDYGIRAIYDDDSNNALTFKADQKPTSETTAKIVNFEQSEVI